VRGATFVTNHPRLWLWILVPLLINAATCGALILLGWELLAPLMPDFAGQHWGWFDGLRTFLAPALRVLALAVSVLASLALTLLVGRRGQRALLRPALRRGSSPPRCGARRPTGRCPRCSPTRPPRCGRRCCWRCARPAFLALFLLLSLHRRGRAALAVAGFWFAGFALADVTLARKRYPARARLAGPAATARRCWASGCPSRSSRRCSPSASWARRCSTWWDDGKQ